MNHLPAESLKEEQILNAFISKLPEGIVVCSSKGEIRLCNKKALHYLVKDSPAGGDDHLVVGNVISDFIDKNLIEHSLDEINEWLKQDILDTVSNFILQKSNLILQVQTLPILNLKGQFTGFVLILADITKQSQAEKRVESLLQVLSKNARSPLASIRAAIEAMIEFPDMESNRQDQFKEIIQKESVVLSDMLNKASDTYASLVDTKGSLLPVYCRELLDTIARRAFDKLDLVLTLTSDVPDEDLYIKADPYFFIMAALYVLNCLKNEVKIKTCFCRFSMAEKIITLDISWPGEPIKPETLYRWETEEIDVDNQRINLTLKEILSHHHAALWTYSHVNGKEKMPYLRFFIPAEERSETEEMEPMPILSESRTQISDLALFDHSVQNPELDDRLLTELSYTSLIREINHANAIEEVIGKHSQLPRLIHSMITSGTKIRTVTWLVTAFAEAILNKIFQFALDEVGPSPVPFAFVTLGSEGRKEQTLKTDQDNAIIFRDPGSEKEMKAVQSYFLKLGEKVCMWLDQAGYDYCNGGIMAKNPKWCQPLSVWKKYFLKWTTTTEPENLMNASIFFDFRFSYGQESIVENLYEYLFEIIQGNAGYFSSMAQNAMQFKPPIGFFNNLITEKKGDYKKCLDIKKANTPIVDFARLYSLFHRIKETNTQDRIYQLYIKKVLSRSEYNEIEQAYSFLMQIRFIGQINSILGEKFMPTNYVNPKTLSSIERKMLKEIFKKIKTFQIKLCLDFTGTPDCQGS